MAETIESIRSGKGMLPKNLHIYAAVIMLVGGLAVMYLGDKNEAGENAQEKEQAKQDELDALRKERPATDQIVKEGESQAAQAKPPVPVPPAPAAEPVRVPPIAIGPGTTIQKESDDARYTNAAQATSPILVLVGDDDRGAGKTPTAAEEALRRLSAPPAATPSVFSPEDRKLLAGAAPGGAGASPDGGGAAGSAPGEEFLVRARQNEAFLQRETAAAQTPRKTIGLDSPVSQFAIVQGSVIPAVTVTPINSDLPGNVVARTTQDIYDSVDGRYLLIPMGSLIYGVYNNAVMVGQERVAVVFHRIVFPNGSGVTLGAMQGTDAAGTAGVPGDVDNHFFEMFGSSLLIAGLAVLVDDSDNTTNFNIGGGTASGSSAQTAGGQVLVDVTRQILGRNTRIPPTVTAPAGQRFNIMVQRDMALRPYEGK